MKKRKRGEEESRGDKNGQSEADETRQSEADETSAKKKKPVDTSTKLSAFAFNKN